MSKLLEGRTVLLTGASRGIGAELAATLSKEGAKLIMATQKFAEEMAGKDISVLINNAGEGARGSGLVNALAPMRLIRAISPKMADKGEGWIINIGWAQSHVV
eukprot:scaffold4.g4686.t1